MGGSRGAQYRAFAGENDFVFKCWKIAEVHIGTGQGTHTGRPSTAEVRIGTGQGTAIYREHETGRTVTKITPSDPIQMRPSATKVTKTPEQSVIPGGSKHKAYWHYYCGFDSGSNTHVAWSRYSKEARKPGTPVKVWWPTDKKCYTAKIDRYDVEADRWYVRFDVDNSLSTALELSVYQLIPIAPTIREYKYVCDQCGRAFQQGFNMRRHQRRNCTLRKSAPKNQRITWLNAPLVTDKKAPPVNDSGYMISTPAHNARAAPANSTNARPSRASRAQAAAARPPSENDSEEDDIPDDLMQVARQSLRLPHSYVALIYLAMKSSVRAKVTLAEIYEYILGRFPYYRNAGLGWKNSIRHTLTQQKCFVKVARLAVDGGGKGGFWAAHESYTELLEEQVAKDDRSFSAGGSARPKKPSQAPNRKIYQCETCPRAFTHGPALATHKRSHSTTVGAGAGAGAIRDAGRRRPLPTRRWSKDAIHTHAHKRMHTHARSR